MNVRNLTTDITIWNCAVHHWTNYFLTKGIRKNIVASRRCSLSIDYGDSGLIHRDLKPENVLIWVDPKEGRVLMKWADFGLSKTVNERGSFSISGIRGTLNWLAPELLKLYYDEDDEETIPSGSGTISTKKRGTIQSDVYTEGLVFGYFLLGGVHLFGSGLKIQSNILKNKPVNLDSKFIQIKFNHKVL